MKRILQILLPVLVLVGAVFLVKKMIDSQVKPKVAPPPAAVPLVRTVVATPQRLRLDVHSQGSIEPRTEVVLSAQVSGRVVAVAPQLRSGGFFAAGATLLSLEDADFQYRVVQQQAAVAAAELKLRQEQAEAEAAVRAWQQLEGDRKADELVSRQLQVAGAETALAAAKASLAQARLDLQRTNVSLPFAGRVRSVAVDIGQQVQAGAELGRVYGVDFAEVRLPIPDDQAAFVDLPLGLDAGAAADHPPVQLTAHFAGRDFTWNGIVDRTEGEIDRRTRQITVVARIADPYDVGDEPDRPPLAIGMFVEATIEGRSFQDVVALPRAAVRPDHTVLVVGPEHQLTARAVDILRLEHDTAMLRGGLAAGEVVCVSNIDSFVEGMVVSVLRDDGSIDGPATPGAATEAK